MHLLALWRRQLPLFSSLLAGRLGWDGFGGIGESEVGSLFELNDDDFGHAGYVDDAEGWWFLGHAEDGRHAEPCVGVDDEEAAGSDGEDACAGLHDFPESVGGVTVGVEEDGGAECVSSDGIGTVCSEAGLPQSGEGVAALAGSCSLNGSDGWWSVGGYDDAVFLELRDPVLISQQELARVDGYVLDHEPHVLAADAGSLEGVNNLMLPLLQRATLVTREVGGVVAG